MLNVNATDVYQKFCFPVTMTVAALENMDCNVETAELGWLIKEIILVKGNADFWS